MQVSLGFLSLSISRNKMNNQKKTSLSDVRVVNEDHVSFLRKLSAIELNGRLEGLVVGEDDGGCERAQKILDEEGIVIIPEFLSTDVTAECSIVIASLEERVAEFIDSDAKTKETESIFFQKGKEKLSSYNELSSYPKTVVQVREGQDQGMVDVFNVDIAYPCLSNLRSAYESNFVKEIFSGVKKEVDFKNLNFYLNSEITETRGFHADSYCSQLKAFVYLTDCLSLDDGPYTYVKGSHIDSAYRRLNEDLCANLPNKTEAPLINRDSIVPVLGKKGTLIISDQCGFHRGFPQSLGHERVISVMNIK